MAIRAVLFDCFGVVAIGTWPQFVASLPTDVDLSSLHEVNTAHDAGLVPDEQFLARVYELTGRVPPSLDDLNPVDQKNESLLNYIRQQVKPHAKVGMLSNVASDWVRQKLLNDEELKLFDDMVFSYEVRLAKPDPAIFRLAAERLGVAPGESVFIDDIQEFVLAANQLGFHGHHYRGLMQLQEYLDPLLRN